MRTRTALAATISAVLLLGGCGNDPAESTDAGGTSAASTPDEPTEPTEAESSEPAEPSTEQSEKPRPTGPFADITFKGGTASPNGERVEIGVGETLTLRIDSDRAGELHVHSTPEQEIAFPSGQSERKLTIEQPGVVDVEDHASGMVLLQLEVR